MYSMQAKDVIHQLVDFSHGLIGMYVQDLDDADLLVRSVPGSNHIAWQLGHIIAGTQHMLVELGHPKPQLPEGWREAYGKETAGSDDPARFAKKEEYLALLEQMKNATHQAIRDTPEDALGAPSPESMQAYAPTIAAALMLQGTHVMMHAGQFVPIRRKLSKPAMF
jgi:hypothetical protein